MSDAPDPTVPDPPAAPLPAEVSIRALFSESSGHVFDERHARLATVDPDVWEGIAFPVEFAMELSSACNLACVMCPVPTTSRAAKLMDDGLFRKVAEEISAESGFVLLPQGFGESMLHPRWADLLGYVRERGIGPVVFLTNGMLLREQNVDRLLASGVDVVVISIDGVDSETYASVRVGGDLGVVEANVRRLLEKRGPEGRPRVVLRIIRMKETAAEIGAFFERWRPVLSPGDEIRVNEFNDWAGKVEDRSVADVPEAARAVETPRRPPCRMLWSNLSLHADGKVSACCHDSEDELVVGDVAKGDTVRGIWTGESLARLRRIHRDGRLAELPICLACRNWS
jgi:radical SAM protein with 4Fe4S-binding SPASM domain